MASLTVDFDDSFFEELGDESEIEHCSYELIESALPILKEKLQSVYSEASSLKLSEGPSMRKARLHIKRPLKAKNGGFIGMVTFGKKNTGHYYIKNGQKYPLSYSGLAVFWEYGTKAHGNFPDMPPHGSIQRAIAESKDEIMKKMQETYDKYIESKKK